MLGQLFTPLSTAAVPLIYGLSHRALLRLGATSHERRLAGIRAHYYFMPARGEGNLPVLLLHGIADRAQTWSFVMRQLTAIGPVYALDLAGFGLSGFPPGQRYATIEQQTALVQAMIREVIGRPTLIVGNSMGAGSRCEWRSPRQNWLPASSCWRREGPSCAGVSRGSHSYTRLSCPISAPCGRCCARCMAARPCRSTLPARGCVPCSGAIR